jgi:hypothetical protein
MGTWFLRQSTASQEIPLGPFVDSADGNTQEISLTIANTDIKIFKAGATTEASKNSGGATHIANGRYYAVLDATDTDTIGPLRVYVHVAGALAVWLDCVVLDEAVYDVLFGTAAPLVAGSNAATTFAALTVSGAFLVSGGTTYTSSTGTGFTCSSTGGNGNGIIFSGNGSGDGLHCEGGATGKGGHLIGGGTSGVGLLVTAGVSGHALQLTASGTSKAGLHITGGDTSGAGIEIVTTSGDGILVTPTAGNALTLTANGTSKHGAVVTGGTAGTSDGLKLVAGTGGVGCRLDTLTASGAVTLSSTLTVSGTTSLAAVTTSGTVTFNALTVSGATTLTGAVSLGSTLGVTGTATLAALTVSGALTAGSNAVPWNAAWDAEVQSEAEDALVAHRLDELLNADSDIDGAAPPTVGSVFHELLSKTAGSFTFDQTTDSLEALRDRGDAAWVTATGFSTHSAADVWAVATRVLTAGTNIQLPSNGLANVTAWTVAITGNVTGNLSGSVGSVTGAINTAAGVITTLDGLDTAQDSQHATTQAAVAAVQADLPQRITKNTALAGFTFLMVLSSDHVTGATGLTVTATRSLDGAAFGACANAVSEVANGIYKIDLAAADLNANVVCLKFTAATADARFITIVTQPT